MTKSAYGRAGVKHLGKASPSESIVSALRQTLAYRKGVVGEPLLDFGPYANVLRINEETGIAVKTDNVGTKVLVAQMMNRYDTIGIDCVAMNVNDLICIGAEPIAMLDYLAVEKARPRVFAEITKGLQEGARQARISIPGGETAQIKDMLKGARKGYGLDLVGTGIGYIHPKEIITGKDARPGDVLIGFYGSGLHSNGYTLLRDVLFKKAAWSIDRYLPELGKTLGEELLTPTKIYVKEFIALRDAGLHLNALFHFTGGGLLNLQRIAAPVGFKIKQWPEPQPIFNLIQRLGKLADEEMFSTFNMGIGFGVVVPKKEQDKALVIARELGSKAMPLGDCISDLEKRVYFEPRGLVGERERFCKPSDSSRLQYANGSGERRRSALRKAKAAPTQSAWSRKPQFPKPL
jgi:phosphoribosylformylglycinamidine cyclo-ligase